MWDAVQLNLHDSTARLVVDRPEEMNVLDKNTLMELNEALQQAKSESLYGLVLESTGEDVFIAGADISYMRGLSVEEAEEWAELGQAVADQLASFPAPTIAAIDGYAFGGGCELPIACDIRIATESALIGNTEIDLGIIPGWGGTQRLSKHVGDEMARRMIYFGKRVDAETAQEIGLVGEVVADNELDERINELLSDLRQKPRFALQTAKQVMNQSYETSEQAGLEYEKRGFASLFGTHDQREGMEAFLEERDATFK